MAERERQLFAKVRNGTLTPRSQISRAEVLANKHEWLVTWAYTALLEGVLKRCHWVEDCGRKRYRYIGNRAWSFPTAQKILGGSAGVQREGGFLLSSWGPGCWIGMRVAQVYKVPLPVTLSLLKLPWLDFLLSSPVKVLDFYLYLHINSIFLIGN